jgi:serpin B
VQAVELPYAGGELSMVVLVPAEGAFVPYAEGLEAEELASFLDELRPAQVRLELPRFSYGAGFKLKNALVELGMVDAFDVSADFSGMDGTRELFIDDVHHKTFISVDEVGTEAAAASAVVVKRKGFSLVQEVAVNRPFLYLIRDVETGAILFLGHVVNPVA